MKNTNWESLNLHKFLFSHKDELFDLNIIQREYLKKTGILIKTHNYPLFEKEPIGIKINWRVLMMMLSGEICTGQSFILGTEKFVKLGDIIEFSNTSGFNLRVTVSSLREETIPCSVQDIPSEVTFKILGSVGERKHEYLTHPSANPDLFYQLEVNDLKKILKDSLLFQKSSKEPNLPLLQEQLSLLSISGTTLEELESGLGTHQGYVINPTNSVLFLKHLTRNLKEVIKENDPIKKTIKKSLVDYFNETLFIKECKNNILQNFNNPLIISTDAKDKTFTMTKTSTLKNLYLKFLFYRKHQILNPFKKYV